MKKISIIIIIFVLLAGIMPLNMEVNAAASTKLENYLYGKGKEDDTFFKKSNNTKELHEYINDGSVNDSNQKICDAIAYKDKNDVATFFDWAMIGDQEMRFGVRYNWLHATVNLLNMLDENDYTQLCNSNNKEQHFKDAIAGLKLARTQLGTFIGDPYEITDGSISFWHPIWTDNAGYDNSETLADPIRSAKAFQDITKEDIDYKGMNAKMFKENETIRNGYLNALGKFDNKINKAIQKLNAARDRTTGKGSCSSADIYINDSYKTKFMYTAAEIKSYDRFYSIGRLGNNNGKSFTDSERNQLKRCWGAKVAASGAGHANVATRTDLYVKKSDDVNTKLAYDEDQIWLYIQIFDPMDGNFLNFSAGSKEFGETVVKWANKLKGTNEFQSNTADGVSSALGYLRGIDNVVQKGIDEINETTKNAEDTTSNYKYDANSASEAASRDEDDRNGNDEEPKIDKDKNTIFVEPKNNTAVATSGPDDVVNDAESFITDGNRIEYMKTEELQNFSQTLYSILFGLGVIISVIIGLILGVKLMVAPVGERADAKKLLIPYAIGCAVVFGAFGIWKLVVTIMQGI